MPTRHPERYRELVARLRQARHEAGMTQAQVAEALGASQQWMSKVETGERRLDVLELEELAGLYGKGLDFFLKKRQS